MQNKNQLFYFHCRGKAPNNNFTKPMAWVFQPLPPPSSLGAKPSAWRFQQPQPLLHKKGLLPQPKALPLSRGRDATAPTRRSFIKVLLPKVGRREIPYATELRLFVFAPLTSMRKTIQFWFLLRLFFAPTLLYGRCRLPRCSLFSKMFHTIYYCKSINTKSTAIQGKNSLSLCLLLDIPPYTISLPKGVRAMSANLKCCLPKGMPMMVM